MRVWYFSEMAYHPAWEEGLKRGSLRVVLPNSNFDPKVGHGLLNRYLDEFALCGFPAVEGEGLTTADNRGELALRQLGEIDVALRGIGPSQPQVFGSRQRMHIGDIAFLPAA